MKNSFIILLHRDAFNNCYNTITKLRALENELNIDFEENDINDLQNELYNHFVYEEGYFRVEDDINKTKEDFENDKSIEIEKIIKKRLHLEILFLDTLKEK